ncbi:MAG: hypothetical protein ACOYX5_19620 [Actinomycetota bacterium]
MGAVAVGGALTGATVAAWRDSAPVDAGVLRTGDLSLSTSLSTTTVAPLEPGQKAYATLTLDARGEGKNLRTVTTIDSVDGFTANGPLTVRFRPKEAGSGQCSELAAADGWEPWNGTPLQLTDPIFPTLTKACVEIAAKPATGVPLGTATFPLSITASLRQVVDGSPIGWSSTSSAPTLGVTTNRKLPAPADLTCTIDYKGIFRVLRITWDPVAEATEYRVFRTTSSDTEELRDGIVDERADFLFLKDLDLVAQATYFVRAYAPGHQSQPSESVETVGDFWTWGCG